MQAPGRADPAGFGDHCPLRCRAVPRTPGMRLRHSNLSGNSSSPGPCSGLKFAFLRHDEESSQEEEKAPLPLYLCQILQETKYVQHRRSWAPFIPAEQGLAPRPSPGVQDK